MSRVRGQSTPKVRMVSNFFQICLSVNDYFYMYYVDIFAHPHNEHDAPKLFLDLQGGGPQIQLGL